MHRRHPKRLPQVWLMTDERQGEGLWRALARLPRGSGVVFRHYSLATNDRLALFRRVERIARARRLILIWGTRGRDRRRPRADGTHGASRARSLQTASVHSLRELIRAERGGADLLFISPVFPTRSHPGARTLGVVRFGLLAHHAQVPVIALGGVSKQRWQRLRAAGAYGWAAIDALS